MAEQNQNPSTASVDAPEVSALKLAIPFFPGANRNQTVAAMLEALANEVPILILTGDAGSGKTTLCEIIDNSIPEGFTGIYFAHAVESFDDVVRLLYREVNHGDAARATATQKLVEVMAETLAQRQSRLILIFDQAERIFLATLERIRRMLDIFNDKQILVQLVFSGKNSLQNNLRQLRIVTFKEAEEREYLLEPLTEEETENYLIHALLTREQKLPEGITAKDVAQTVFRETKGNFAATKTRVEEVFDQIKNNLLQAGKPLARQQSKSIDFAEKFNKLKASMDFRRFLPKPRPATTPKPTFFDKNLRDKFAAWPKGVIAGVQDAFRRFGEKQYLSRCASFVLVQVGASKDKIFGSFSSVGGALQRGFASIRSSIKSIQPPQVPKVTLPKVSLPKIELRKMSLPKVEKPSLKLPDFKIPSVKVPVGTGGTGKLIGGAVVVAVLIFAGLQLTKKEGPQSPGFVRKDSPQLTETPAVHTKDEPQGSAVVAPPSAEEQPKSEEKAPGAPVDTGGRYSAVAENSGGDSASTKVSIKKDDSNPVRPVKEKTTEETGVTTASRPVDTHPAAKKESDTAALKKVESQEKIKVSESDTAAKKALAIKAEQEKNAALKTHEEDHKEVQHQENIQVKKIAADQKKKFFDISKADSAIQQKTESVVEHRTEHAANLKTAKTQEDEKHAVADLKQKLLKSEQTSKITTEEAKSKTEKPEATDGAYKKGLKAGEKWVGQKNDNRYTVQIATSSQENAQAILKELSSNENYKEIADKLTIVKSGSGSVSLYYGDYASMTEARNARNTIPAALKRYNPYAISVDGALGKNKSR